MATPALADRLAFSILGFTVDLSLELALRAGPGACTAKRMRGVEEAALLLAHLEVHLPLLWQRYEYAATLTALVRQLVAAGTPRLAQALVPVASCPCGAAPLW
ncbi:MAG: hypothetical protein Q8L14_23475 [Myxococcales bacterium]|nr:hypothetical protein [Myxococcales bacterium]